MQRRLVLFAPLLLLPLWLQVASPSGDLWSRWTDHLRHEAEALGLEQHGFGLYTRTFDEATAGLALPCPDHTALWGTTGIPYPPLGVLLHAPIAHLERAHLLPPRAHALLTWAFGACGLFATALGASMLRGWRRWTFVALFGPLLVGVGLSGFYDTTFVLAAMVALRARSRWAAVVAWLLHFRGVVALTLADFRRGALLPLAAIVLNGLVAFVAAQHLGVFETHSQLHYTRAVAWWFPTVTALCVGLTRREGFAVTWVLTAALMFTDRQASFWHLLVLVPLVVRVLRDGSPRAAVLVLVWTVATAQAFLDTWVPFPVFWMTMR